MGRIGLGEVMNKNTITKVILGGMLVMPTLLVADEYIVRAPVDADLSQWQNMPPEYGDWEATSEQYACSTWTPDTFDYLVGEPVEQTQTCSQDMERSVTHKEYDNFSGEERVISESVESDTHDVINERQATGTRALLPPELSEWESVGEPYDCSEWTPEADTMPENDKFVQSRTCMQEQEQTTTVWAEDISTGEQEIHSEEVTEQANEITQEQDAIGTMHIGRNMCVDILERGESTGNGVYRVSPDTTTVSYKDAYCDMTGGGWTLYDGFGTHLQAVGGNNPAAYNHQVIWNLYDIDDAGYDRYLDRVNTNSYTVSAYHTQFFYGGSPQGWIKKIMPDWAKQVKARASNEWYGGIGWVKYGEESHQLEAYQKDTDFIFNGGGKEIKFQEAGIIWVESLWVK